MNLNQQTLQKIMNKHYRNIQIEYLKHCSHSDQVFIIKTPYQGTMKENIILTLYYNQKSHNYVLSDDGYTTASILLNHSRQDRPLQKYLKNKLHHVSFNTKNEAFQETFYNIHKIVKAYYYLTHTIINFIGAFSSFTPNI